MKPESYLKYYLTEQWKQIKDAFLRKHGRHCDLCKARYKIEVHHINYDSVPGSEKYEDLMAVCNKCHNTLHQDLNCFKSSSGNRVLKISKN